MSGSSSTGQATLSTTAAVVVAGDPNAPTLVFLYDVDGSIGVHWGYSAAVTTSTGVPLSSSKGIGIPLDAGESLWAVADSGTPTIAWAKARQLQRST